MRLETWDELEEQSPIFCSTCGKQVQTLDEMNHRLCHSCKSTHQQAADDLDFHCWACGKHLGGMGEIAQGVCDHCRASIIRKLHE